VLPATGRVDPDTGLFSLRYALRQFLTTCRKGQHNCASAQHDPYHSPAVLLKFSINSDASDGSEPIEKKREPWSPWL
jgi:hypothetical protein